VTHVGRYRQTAPIIVASIPTNLYWPSWVPRPRSPAYAFVPLVMLTVANGAQ
jgi:hypothetical protein